MEQVLKMLLMVLIDHHMYERLLSPAQAVNTVLAGLAVSAENAFAERSLVLHV